jgi:hypothetical protein
MNFLLGVLLVIVLLLSLGVILAIVRTYQMEHSAMQQQFEKGVANIATLDGDYKGIAHGYEGSSWQGKTLTRASHMGINRFLKNGESSTNYPFRFYISKGLRDTNLDVITLDYNQEGNPWWLKFIVDEMMEISPKEYLGKVHVQIAPQIVFTLGYFTLSK